MARSLQRAPRSPGKATLFHLVLHALASVLHERPRLNRFIAGRRIYDRDGVFVSFAAKKKMDDDAPLSTVKRRFAPGESFDELVAALGRDIGDARSDRKSTVDRELGVLLRLPAPALDLAVAALRRLDAWGLAPSSLTASDPMYTSAFVANLGSLRIDAAYHHLYEHGNCPLFVAIGQVAMTPVVRDGAIVARPILPIRYSFDERVEDGLYCAGALDLLRLRIEEPGVASKDAGIGDARDRADGGVRR
jgi:pyruvate/2-oxoglutarate dehydrogenase complex dihydrolipoamide acyltransferase (E2) component